MREREEIDASVRICRVDVCWIVVRVREARVAEGSVDKEGRVRVEREYEIPWISNISANYWKGS